MLDIAVEKLQKLFDAVTQFLWESFEKDVALTESLISRTEAVVARIEEKFFRNPPR